MTATETTAVRDQASRHSWMDLSRGLAILLVVIVHAGSIYRESGSEHPHWITALDWAMAPYRMPMLIFLSGFLLERSLSKGVVEFCYGKLRNIAWPFALWTVLYCFALFDPARILDPVVWRGGTYLWYMLFLGSYFAVALLTARVPHLIVAVYVLAIAFIMPDGSKYGERLFALMAYFFIGAAAGQHAERFVELLRNRWALTLVPVSIGLSLSSAVIARIPYSSPAYSMLVVPAVLGVCAIMARVPAGRFSDMLQFVGRRSVVYYVMHVPIYALIFHVTLPAGLTSPYFNLVLCIATAVAVATIFAHLIERWALVSALFSFPDVISFAPQSPAARLSATIDKLPILRRRTNLQPSSIAR